MKYYKLTIDYIKRNFLMTVVYAILPALLFSFFINPCSMLEYNFKEFGTSTNFWEIYKQVNDIARNYAVFVLPFVFILSVVAFSSMIGGMQRKMRFGKMFGESHTFFTRVNNNFMAVFKAFIFVCLICMLFGLVMALFIFFWIKKLPTMAVFAVPITYVILFLLIAGVVLLMMLCLPLMTVRGYGFFKSINLSLQVTGRDPWRFFIGLALPMTILYIPMMIISALHFPGQAYVAIIVRIFFYTATFTYIITYFYTSFFELEQIEREDLKINSYGEN